jgi:putative hydroxymethylpyrimidine transport system ATP-binding protein
MSQPAPQIIIRDTYLAYDNVVLFDHLNITLSAGKCTCLLGSSGVGKSTLLRLIAGIITENEKTLFHGKIYCDENLSLPENIAYMAQSDLLLPWLTALDNALLGSHIRGQNNSELIAKAKDLFHKVGLNNAMKKYPYELSGGMKQRVALIRTLLEDKPIVLMDEPFSSLDAITRFELQDLASELLKNRTVLLVTHDPIEALRIGNEIFVMSGQPAILKTILSLSTSTPRALSDKDVIKNQETLFEALVKAKEKNK